MYRFFLKIDVIYSSRVLSCDSFVELGLYPFSELVSEVVSIYLLFRTFLQVVVISNPNFGLILVLCNGEMWVILLILYFMSLMLQNRSYDLLTLRVHNDYLYVLLCRGDLLLNRHKVFQFVCEWISGQQGVAINGLSLILNLSVFLDMSSQILSR